MYVLFVAMCMIQLKETRIAVLQQERLLKICRVTGYVRFAVLIKTSLKKNERPQSPSDLFSFLA